MWIKLSSTTPGLPHWLRVGQYCHGGFDAGLVRWLRPTLDKAVERCAKSKMEAKGELALVRRINMCPPWREVMARRRRSISTSQAIYGQRQCQSKTWLGMWAWEFNETSPLLAAAKVLFSQLLPLMDMLEGCKEGDMGKPDGFVHILHVGGDFHVCDSV
jgi:hypothetical protein